MEGYFFDTLGEWPKLFSYCNHGKFIEALNIYHWWNFRSEIGNSRPLIQFKSFEDSSIDESHVLDQLKLSFKPSTTPYWYCVPHDCVELNSIVMGTLVSLYTQKEVFCLCVTPIGVHDIHVVVCNKRLSSGDEIHLVRNEKGLVTACHKDVVQDSKIIIYDLIYPLTSFWGNSWINREKKLKKLTVLDSSTLKENWKDMNYVSYYHSH
jgi:hypothetical protein